MQSWTAFECRVFFSRGDVCATGFVSLQERAPRALFSRRARHLLPPGDGRTLSSRSGLSTALASWLLRDAPKMRVIPMRRVPGILLVATALVGVACQATAQDRS